jgi:hypothetical protein
MHVLRPPVKLNRGSSSFAFNYRFREVNIKNVVNVKNKEPSGPQIQNKKKAWDISKSRCIFLAYYVCTTHFGTSIYGNIRTMAWIEKNT